VIVGGSQYTRTWVTSHISKTMFNMNFQWVIGFCIATQVCENIKEWTIFFSFVFGGPFVKLNRYLLGIILYTMEEFLQCVIRFVLRFCHRWKKKKMDENMFKWMKKGWFIMSDNGCPLGFFMFFLIPLLWLSSLWWRNPFDTTR